MAADKIQLIVGLGNPGLQYSDTRHNAGFWFVDALLQVYGAQLSKKEKFFSLHTKLDVSDCCVHVLCPDTFMNNSGKAVAAISNFYRIEPEHILIVYDDLELPVGSAKLKDKGGHSGHNGIADIMQSLSSKSFKRLRIGIGRPEPRVDISSYVLSKMPLEERTATNRLIDKALESVVDLVAGNWQVAVQKLHRIC